MGMEAGETLGPPRPQTPAKGSRPFGNPLSALVGGEGMGVMAKDEERKNRF